MTTAALLGERYDPGPKKQRVELMTSAATKLEETAQLLSKAEEQVLANQVAELADLVDVIATPEPERAYSD